MPTVQELEALFTDSDSSDNGDDAGDEDYRDDDDQAPVQQRSRRRVHEPDEEKEEEKEVEQTKHVPDRPDHVEEGGHVPEDGQNYREPRPPFTGTIWNGRINAFVRLDQIIVEGLAVQDLRATSGSRASWATSVHACRPRRTRSASTRWRATTNDLMELARTCSLDEKCRMRHFSKSRGKRVDRFDSHAGSLRLLTF